MRFTFYRFEKWFFDILSEEREYTIIFLNLLQFMGMKFCYLAIDHCGYDNKKPKFKSFSMRLKVIERNDNVFVTDKGIIKIGKDFCSFDLSSDELTIQANMNALSSTPPEMPGLLIRKNKRQVLNWKPQALRNQTKSDISIKKTNILAEGNGYSDYLTSTFQPFGIPVKTLFWGHVHGKRFDLTYSYAEGKAGNCQTALIYHSDKKCRQLEIEHLEPSDFRYVEETGISCPTSYRILAKSRALRLSMEVRHLKPAIISTFSDIPNKSGGIVSSWLKKLLRDPRGGKFFSSAHVEISVEGQRKVVEECMMIDEYIEFSV